MNAILNIAQLTCHPYCLAIPEMTEAEYQELKGDIAGSGQLEPIVMFAGQILDGRHRYRACMELGIEPFFKEYDGPDSVMDYVISANLRRRHLSESQRAQAMANLCTLARGRPALTVVTVDAEPALFEVKPVETNVQICTFTREEAAEKAGVSVRTMSNAMDVDRKGSPELIDAVKRGDIAVSAAAKVVQALPERAALH